MNHGWNHALCYDCWGVMFPGRKPFRVREADEERCCGCGRATSEGIYARREPGSLPHCGIAQRAAE